VRERQAEAAGGGAVVGEANSEGCGGGKLLSPERRRGAVRYARESYRVSDLASLKVLHEYPFLSDAEARNAFLRLQV
jgi:hypothetical protein